MTKRGIEAEAGKGHKTLKHTQTGREGEQKDINSVGDPVKGHTDERGHFGDGEAHPQAKEDYGAEVEGQQDQGPHPETEACGGPAAQGARFVCREMV